MATITIPTDEAREGDTARISGTFGELRLPVVLIPFGTEGKRPLGVNFLHADTTLAAIHILAGAQSVKLEIERDVPDLPTEPGAVFRANLQRGGERRTMMRVKAGSGLVFEAAEAGGEAPEVFAANEIDLATVELATITWGADA